MSSQWDIFKSVDVHIKSVSAPRVPHFPCRVCAIQHAASATGLRYERVSQNKLQINDGQVASFPSLWSLSTFWSSEFNSFGRDAAHLTVRDDLLLCSDCVRMCACRTLLERKSQIKVTICCANEGKMMQFDRHLPSSLLRLSSCISVVHFGVQPMTWTICKLLWSL